MMVFLDWASTSPMIRFTAGQYGNHYINPNAAYAFEERTMLMDCEERIKAAIGVKSGHVLYFRCATEAIDWLHDRSITRKPDVEWFNSLTEHDACDFGVVCSPQYVEEYCTRDVVGREHEGRTDFYIHQWVNHVTGEIFNFKTIRSQLPKTCKLIVDATAGFGKAKLPSGLDDIADALFMSGHKIGCPELSFMWLSDNLCEWLGAVKDIRNQWGLHHGSLSVASVMALTDAIEDACDDYLLAAFIKNNLIRYHQMFTSLSGAGIDFEIIRPTIKISAINAIRLKGLNADALQQFLATRGIYVGVGSSACSAAHDYRGLRAYGLTDDEASEVIRVSFGDETTADDIEALVEDIKEYRRKFC